MNRNRWGLPNLGIGLGLRSRHAETILDAEPAVGFFEALTENYLGTAGGPPETLAAIAARYPVVMHGVSLSIGSTEPIDSEYLRSLRDLAERVGALWVSDHVCWTGVGGVNTHELLPLPYDEPTLRHCVDRVRAVSDFLGRPLVLENPTSYVRFERSTMSEVEFLVRMAEEADCGLLLDVNNVYVNACNHGESAEEFIDLVPPDRVVQIHIAGHTDVGTHLLDTHGSAVSDSVWALYGRFVRRAGAVATCLEWDDGIPDLETCWREACHAERWLGREVKDGVAA